MFIAYVESLLKNSGFCVCTGIQVLQATNCTSIKIPFCCKVSF